MRFFFREIACEGIDRIPKDAGGLVVAWHPNGLIDPALILSYFPGRIIFGARHGLFRWPLVGRLMRIIGTVPIYRAIDTSDLTREDQLAANEASLDALARALSAGSYSALFPEGISHDEPHLTEVKTGAARLYYRARELTDPVDPPPVIIPVGLHYDRKNIFRSRVLVSFHDPIALPNELDVRPSENDSRADIRARYRGLTDLIEEKLVEIVHTTEDWRLHHLMHRARKLMRAERSFRANATPGPPSISEWELGFARVWYGYRARMETNPEEIRILRKDLAGYDRTLTALGLEDYEISKAPRFASPLWYTLFVLQLVTVYLFLPPILLIGVIINVIPYGLLKLFDRLLSKDEKDAASVKVLGGAVLFPLVWAVAAFLAARGDIRLHEAFPVIPDIPGIVAITAIILGFLSGMVALRYSEYATESFHAMRVQITRNRRKNLVDDLRKKRSELYERFARLEEGLDLPGEVAPDGRIVSRS